MAETNEAESNLHDTNRNATKGIKTKRANKLKKVVKLYLLNFEELKLERLKHKRVETLTHFHFIIIFLN